MNRFTKMKEHKTLPERQTAMRSPGNKLWVWTLMAKVIMITFLISGAHFTRVVFKAKTVSLNKEAGRIEQEICRLKQETLNLRNRKAELSASSYIREKTKKLGLRAADYTQIQHVALLQEPVRTPGRLRTDYAKRPEKKSSAAPYTVSRNTPEKKTANTAESVWF
ncbi:MAG: hypothetical protein IKA79_07435 [Lentisphaeria bacterium]|nr:hypothetical protein [Lentisphaeria bacterium]